MIIPIRFQIYMCSLAVAHLAEYLFVASFHNKDLCWSSFLINQSKFYVLAHGIALNEYVIEHFFIPEIDLFDDLYYIVRRLTLFVGLLMIIIGHIFRISAMFTAASNFHHIV